MSRENNPEGSCQRESGQHGAAVGMSSSSSAPNSFTREKSLKNSQERHAWPPRTANGRKVEAVSFHNFSRIILHHLALSSRNFILEQTREARGLGDSSLQFEVLISEDSTLISSLLFRSAKAWTPHCRFPSSSFSGTILLKLLLCGIFASLIPFISRSSSLSGLSRALN